MHVQYWPAILIVMVIVYQGKADKLPPVMKNKCDLLVAGGKDNGSGKETYNPLLICKDDTYGTKDMTFP